jgi:hypothetical protein
VTSRISIALVLVLFIAGGVGPRSLRRWKVGSHCLLAQSTELPAPEIRSSRTRAWRNCVHDANDAAHNCGHRECKQNTDATQPPEGVMREDRSAAYRFKDHRHCPVNNRD